MKQYLRALTLGAATLVAGGAWAGDVTEEQIQALEARIAQLETTSVAGGAAAGDRLRINGFLTVGAAMALAGDDYDYTGLDDHWSMDSGAVLGLQLDGKINDRMRAIVQLLGRGGTDKYSIDAEWAFVGWQVNDSNTLRFGRQRFPFFVMSEYLGVGYAYPWVQPPQSVYQEAFPAAYDGISWEHVSEVGEWSHTVQAFYGREEFDIFGGHFSLDDSIGLTWQGVRGPWQFSANYSQSKSTFSSQLDTFVVASGLAPATDVLGWFGGLGLQYDDGTWLVLSEATVVRVDGYFPDSDNFYLTVGHRFGKLMPHLTWAVTRSADKKDRPDATALFAALCPAVDPDPAASLCLAIIPNGAPPPNSFGVAFPGDTIARLVEDERTTVTLGLRYDVAENAAFKFDWTRSLDTHGTYGGFQPKDGNVFTGPLPDDDADIFRVALDVVF